LLEINASSLRIDKSNMDKNEIFLNVVAVAEDGRV